MNKQANTTKPIHPLPEPKTIKAFLSRITRRWNTLSSAPLLELRGLRQGAAPEIWQYPLCEIQSAVDDAFALNGRGHNLYVCVNPIVGGTAGTATDSDIACALFCFADADDATGSDAIKKANPKPSFVVKTGTTPWERLHAYWELEQPCYDLACWRTLQRNIASNLGTDKSITNPSRIMRLAGTVAYPSAQKASKGYIPELVEFQHGELLQ